MDGSRVFKMRFKKNLQKNHWLLTFPRLKISRLSVVLKSLALIHSEYWWFLFSEVRSKRSPRDQTWFWFIWCKWGISNTDSFQFNLPLYLALTSPAGRSARLCVDSWHFLSNNNSEQQCPIICSLFCRRVRLIIRMQRWSGLDKQKCLCPRCWWSERSHSWSNYSGSTKGRTGIIYIGLKQERNHWWWCF